MATQPALIYPSLWRVGDIVLRLLTAAGLAIDAYVHADLAGNEIHTEGVLFGLEAGVSSLAALILVITGMRLAYVFAFLIAISALSAIMVYRYVDIGAIGPIPNMYEPIWFQEKAVAAIAEGTALVTAAAGALIPHSGRRLLSRR